MKGEGNAAEVLERLVAKLASMLGTKGLEVVGKGARKAQSAQDEVATTIKLKLTVTRAEGRYKMGCKGSVTQQTTEAVAPIEDVMDERQRDLPFPPQAGTDGPDDSNLGDPPGPSGPVGCASGAGATVPGEVSPELIQKAVDLLRETGRASVSAIQRRLKIGFVMAGRVMDELENRGVVSRPRAGGVRDILDLEVAV